MKDELKELRKEIDQLNQELLKILSSRGKVVKKIGKIKQKKGMPIVDKDREDEILNKIISQYKGPYSSKQIKKIFREIFKQSVALQKEDL
ncbi:MAG TPA: chorismate mutase [Halanaerobiales bacterium]|nr:chorismate mutase [Halanaerobiales bacterium]